ncbi:MAG: hypothetical protein A2284_15655 [Deltaproteobacteria bacterium RIFOXYA12_FULL_61_11]|nr:MAG: hypothetical protein A2284_15655 [Deltaproteobacteria bacterium RIFOXYA12_FULL_61_11]
MSWGLVLIGCPFADRLSCGGVPLEEASVKGTSLPMVPRLENQVLAYYGLPCPIESCQLGTTVAELQALAKAQMLPAGEIVVVEKVSLSGEIPPPVLEREVGTRLNFEVKVLSPLVFRFSRERRMAIIILNAGDKEAAAKAVLFEYLKNQGLRIDGPIMTRYLQPPLGPDPNAYDRKIMVPVVAIATVKP